MHRTAGWWLRRARIDAGVSQPQMAILMGCSQAHISRMETSRRSYGPRDIRKWMDLLTAPSNMYDAAVVAYYHAANQSYKTTAKLSSDGAEALEQLRQHCGTDVASTDDIINSSLVFTRDTVVRLGNWRVRPVEDTNFEGEDLIE